MENIKKSVMPESMWAENPELAQKSQDVYDYLMKTPFSKAFPNKYKAITKSDARMKAHKLLLEDPNMPLKSVVATVLNGLDEDLSPALVLEMTHVIIEKWEEMTASTYVDERVEELV